MAMLGNERDGGARLATGEAGEQKRWNAEYLFWYRANKAKTCKYLEGLRRTAEWLRWAEKEAQVRFELQPESLPAYRLAIAADAVKWAEESLSWIAEWEADGDERGG